MTTILTHMYRVRAILALLLFLSSVSLRAQSDDATLINITTLAQLDAIHHDLDGDGTPSGNTAEQAAYRTAFGLGAGVNNTCTGGCVGYELRNDLDFEDVSGSPSIWSENCTDGACQTATAVDGDNADKVGWEPLGYYNSDTDNASYTATFDGRGHTISNLYINRPSIDNVGLFGDLGGNVRNLGIEGGSLSGAGDVGGLSGYSTGTISACYATGTATGTANNVGGLVGFNSGGTISACYATGDASGSDGVGGLVGNGGNGTISACYATGTATGTASSVGGLVGTNFFATISACYATGDATGTDYVGGLVGFNSGGTISACYATGDATGTANSVGGLVGFNSGGTISACYATGDASGSSEVGGLSGSGNSSGTISACYSTGDATGSSDVGGLVGKDDGTVTNSYFDSSVSNRTSSDSYDKTTTELQTPTAYAGIYANWNIDVDNGQPIGVDDGTAAGDPGTDNPWDFGTNMQYPALRADFNVDGGPTAFEFGGQGRAAPTAPDAPSALTAMAANAAVILNWTAASDGGAPITGYMIGYDTDMNFSSPPTTVSTMAAATSYTASSLTNGTPYYFRVAAVNAVGTSAYYPGALSAAVSATPAPTAPAAPTALTATAADAAVTLNWTAPSDNGGDPITNYMIGYDTDMNFSSPPTTVSTMAAATSYTASSLANGTPYYFRVAAVNSVGTGAYYPGAGDDAVSATPAPPVVSSFTPTTGAVGETVMIWGTGFSSTATEDSISFGGSPYVVASSFIADTRIRR